MHPLIKKIAALFVPVAALVCAATFMSYHAEQRRIESEFIDQCRESVRLAHAQMVARLGILESDIRYLARSHALSGYLRSPGDASMADLQSDWRLFAVITSYSIHYTKLYEGGWYFMNGTLRGSATAPSEKRDDALTMTTLELTSRTKRWAFS